MTRDKFQERLASAKEGLARTHSSAAPSKPAAQSLAIGWRLAMELLAAMAVGGFCGWWLDLWFNTAPIFLLLLVFLGSAAGIWSIYRQSRAMSASQSAPADPKPGAGHHER